LNDSSTGDEAAALLKIHPKTIHKMARAGQITGVQIGRLWRFRASVLNDWLERKMMRQPATEE
jgi:excisionase family DNA binding protein